MGLTSILLLTACVAASVHGHGYLMEPPGRASAWRFGFDTPIDYNDNECFCGGFAYQYEQMGGKCGICGDAWDADPRPHEVGGIYATGTIVRNYNKGQVIPVTANVTANHLGHFEYKICANNDVTVEATQECLDLTPVFGVGHEEWYLYIDDATGAVSHELQLPADLECTQCVLQWRYVASNTWGTCDNGTEGVGCGPQEEFRACADVSVLPPPQEWDGTVSLLPAPVEEAVNVAKEEPTVQEEVVNASKEEPTVQEEMVVNASKEEPTVQEKVVNAAKEEPTVQEEEVVNAAKEEPTVQEEAVNAAKEEPTVQEEMVVNASKEEPTAQEEMVVNAAKEEPTVQEEMVVNAAKEEPTVQEEMVVNASKEEPTVQEEKAVNAAKAEPTVQEEKVVNAAKEEPTVQEEKAVNAAKAEPTVQEEMVVNASKEEPTVQEEVVNAAKEEPTVQEEKVVNATNEEEATENEETEQLRQQPASRLGELTKVSGGQVGEHDARTSYRNRRRTQVEESEDDSDEDESDDE